MYSADDMRDLRCMSFTSKATSEILVAGLQDIMFVIDVNKGDIVKRVSCSSPSLFPGRIVPDLARFPPQTTTSR